MLQQQIQHWPAPQAGIELSALIARKLDDFHINYCASPDFLEKHGPINHPSDLSRLPCIIDTNFRDPHHWPFAQGQKVAVAGRLAFSNASACLCAAEAGLGIACMPDFAAREAVAAGRVLRLLADWTVDTRYQGTAYLLFAASRHTPPKVRALIDHLVAALAPGVQPG